MATRRTRKKSNAPAIFAVVVSLLCAAALVLGLFTDWYTNFDKLKIKGGGKTTTPTAETLYAPDGGLLINQTTSQGIALYSAATPLADFVTYSLDDDVEAVKTITARFTPEDTTLQEVDYTADWKNAASSWATDKDVNDYITLTQPSDGSLDCYVSLLDAFGEQIIITCTARPLEEGDWVPSATCTVDYYKRVTLNGLTFSSKDSDSDDLDWSIEVKNGATLSYTDYYKDYGDNYCEKNITYSTGTVNDALRIDTLTLSVSDSIAASVKSAAGVSTLKSYTLPHGGEDSYYLKIKSGIDEMLGGESNVQSHRAAIYNAFKMAYDSNKTVLKFEVHCTGYTSKIEYDFTFDVKFNPLALGTKAQDVGLDKPSIIFSLRG